MQLFLSLSLSKQNALRVQQKIRFLKTENTFCILSSKKNIQQHTVLSCCSGVLRPTHMNVPKMNASTFCAHVFNTRVVLPFSRRRVFFYDERLLLKDNTGGSERFRGRV